MLASRGRQRSALRHSERRGLPCAVRQHHPGGQVAADESERPATPDLLPQRSHQPVVVDRVEERLEVAIDHLAAAFRPAGRHFGHRVMRGVAGPVAVAVFAEIRFKARTQHLRDGLLDHAIQHRRNPQRTLGPVGLVDPHPFDGCGSVGAIPDGFGDPRPVLPRERGELFDGHAIDPRSTLVGLHALPRFGHVLRGDDRLDLVSRPRVSVLPSATALVHASPSGVVGWGVRHGVETLLIGSVLHRVSPSGNFAVLPALRLVSSTTMTSADSSRTDGREVSPGKGTLLLRTAAAFTSTGIPGDFAVLCQLVAPCRPSTRFLSIGSRISHSLPSRSRSPSSAWPLVVVCFIPVFPQGT